MTHPHVLHAQAALWSLLHARTALMVQVGREARHNGAQLLAAAPISSPQWGSRHPAGSHGDPTGLAVVADPVRETTWAERAQRLMGRLGWLADQVDPVRRLRDPLARITSRLPHLHPGRVAAVARHLADEDRWVRDALQLAPEETLLAGTQCPACGHRPLRTVPTGPAGGVVVCRPGCLCVGEGCGCGMPVLAAGVVHVWALVGVALAA